MNKITTKSIPIILTFFLPFTYLFGVFLTELTALSIIIYFFIFCKNLNIYFKDKKIIFIFIFSLYLAFNSILQIDDNLKYSSIFYLRYLLFSLSIFYFFEFFYGNRKLMGNYFIYIIFIILLIVFSDSLKQFFSGKNFLGYELQKLRVSSFFGSELVLGSFLIKILPFITWLIFFLNIDIDKRRTKLMLVIFLSLYFITIYLSAERLSITLLFLFIFFTLFLVKNLRFYFFISTVGLIIFAICVSYFNLGKSPTHHRVFIETFNQITNYTYHDCCKNKNSTNIENEKNYKVSKIQNIKNFIKKLKIYSLDHQGHVLLAYELFKNNKYFGVGPKGFRHYCRSVNYDPEIGICSTHPHNYTIQFLSELGLLGIIFYVIFFVFIIYKLIRCIKSKNSTNFKNSFYIISIGLIVNFFPILPSGNFFNNWNSLIYFYLVGIYFFSYKKIFH